MRVSFIAIGPLVLLAGLVLPFGAQADQSAVSLNQFVDESGRLNLPDGFTGNIDPTGFEMMTDGEGPPLFLPSSASSFTVGEWETFGSVVNGCNGPVWALAYAGNDQLFVGGRFTICGQTATSGVARLDLATGQFHALGEGADNGVNTSVSSLAVADQDLYVGGSFTEAGGQPVNRVARWDGSAWHALGAGAGNGVSARVASLAVSGSELFVGGTFSEAGGQSANRVARWDGSAWHALGEGATNGAVGYSVNALAVSGADLYVGGTFTEVGGQLANRIARWDGSSWHALGEGAGNGISFEVNALAISDGNLFVGGDFFEAGGQPSNYLARWDGSVWHPLGDGEHNGVNFRVQDLAIVGPDLYVAGWFNEAGGQSANRIARWDGSAWHALGEGVGGIGALSLSNVDGDLYVGGLFSTAGSQSANYLARWNGATWQALSKGAGNGVNHGIDVVAATDTDLYIGGIFTQAGSQSVLGVARWDGSEWHALGEGIGSGWPGNRVAALAISGSDVYAGGYFLDAGGQAARNVARWDGSAWHALGDGVSKGIDGWVDVLVVSGSNLYVGGSFSEAGGQSANNVARWDGSEWHSLGDGAGNGLDDSVTSLVVSGPDLYVGGFFTNAGGQPAKRVARWDGSTWHALGEGLDASPGYSVNTLAVSGSDLFVGGSTVTAAGGLPVNRVARWDGTAWHALGEGIGSGVNDYVSSLTVVGQDLYAGGSFTEAGGQLANSVARWDGSEWHSLGEGTSNGVSGGVFSLASNADRVFVAGGFGLAGGVLSSNIATYIPPQPLIALSSDTLNFGNIEPGQSSPPSALVVVNDGTAALEISGVSIQSAKEMLDGRGVFPFTIEYDDCSGVTLVPGETCIVEIIFSPIDTEPQQARLRIGSNAQDTPAFVTLTGNETIFQDQFE